MYTTIAAHNPTNPLTEKRCGNNCKNLIFGIPTSIRARQLQLMPWGLQGGKEPINPLDVVYDDGATQPLNHALPALARF